MKELGELLRARREELGLSLDEAADRARLSSAVLGTMEMGNFEDIGTALLIRNFLRNACSAYDLDAEALLQRYEAEIRLCDVQQRSLEWYAGWAKNFPRRRRFGLTGAILLVFLVVAITSGVVWFSRRQQMWLGTAATVKNGYPQQDIPADLSLSRSMEESSAGRTVRDGRESSGPAPQSTAVAPDSGQEGKPKVGEPALGNASRAVTGTPPSSGMGFLAGLVGKELVGKESANVEPAAPQVDTPQKHRLNIQAVDKTWIKVRIGNRKSQSTLLNPGQILDWEVEGAVQVVIGNAGGVRMVWDGKEINLPAKPGRVVRVRLPDPQYTGG